MELMDNAVVTEETPKQEEKKSGKHTKKDAGDAEEKAETEEEAE